MNARSNYFILFGFCLALFSSSTLAAPVGAPVADPLGRIASMGNSMVSSVRSPAPYHFANLASSASRVIPTVDVWGALFRLRYTGMGVNMNVPAIVTYSRVAAVGALRGCISSGPACLGGAVLGVGVGLGIEYFLSSSGYSFDSSTGGFVEIEGTITSPVDSCVSYGRQYWYATCGDYPLGTVYIDNHLVNPDGVLFTDIESAIEFVMQYYNDENSWANLTRYSDCMNCGSAYEVRGWQLNDNGSSYWLPISFYDSDNALTSFTIFFNTGSIQGGLELSDVISVDEVGSPVAPSVVLENLDFDLYEPDSSDFAILGNRLVGVPPVSIEFEDFPPFTLPPVTDITYDEFGGPITTTTTTTVTPAVVGNGTAAPAIEISTNTNTVVETVNGVISDTNTGTIVRPVPDAGVNPDTGVAYPPYVPPNADVAYSCWSFQFICDWFRWTQDVPDVSIDQVNFDEIKAVSEIEYIQRSVNVGVSASCPAGQNLDLGHFGDFSVSYDPFCELAETSKPLFLTFMSLLSIFIVYRAFSS